jgi:DNA-directed RNA polymerase specialized sigma24 family protein
MSKQFNRFEEVRSIIDSSDDLEMMKSCQGLLRDIIKINDLEETLEKARAALYEEQKRRFFSFFVEGLPPLEIAALADKCSGRVKVLEKKESKT